MATYYKDYYRDPVTGKCTRRTAKERRALRERAKRKHTASHKEAPTVAPRDAMQDYELVTEYLKEDPKSPTGLAWAIDNHDKPWLASFKEAGSVAGNVRDNKVHIKGHRLSTLRCLYMLQSGNPVGTVSPTDGSKLYFVKPKGSKGVYLMTHSQYVKHRRIKS